MGILLNLQGFILFVDCQQQQQFLIIIPKKSFVVGKLTCENCGHINEILPKDVLEYVPKCYHCGRLLTSKEGSNKEEE